LFWITGFDPGNPHAKETTRKANLAWWGSQRSCSAQTASLLMAPHGKRANQQALKKDMAAVLPMGWQHNGPEGVCYTAA